MRGNSNNMSTVKAILKVLQEHFCTVVHSVVIIKPDNFWQKQRASISSHKYKFETSTISLEGLQKMIDIGQLTTEFDGTLNYDHNQWIEIRMALEEFLWPIGDMLDRIEDLQEDISRSDFAEDVNGAKHGIEHHNDMKKKIVKLPIEELDVQGQKLLAKLNADSSRQSDHHASHSSQKSHATMPSNPDMAAIFQQVLQQLDSVHKGQQHLLTVWNHKKTKLDQCFQLRLFEQDCEKMFDWILHNRDVFQMSYVEIGHNYSLAKSLQDEHQKFAVASMNVGVNINRILAVAGRLIEGTRLYSLVDNEPRKIPFVCSCALLVSHAMHRQSLCGPAHPDGGQPLGSHVEGVRGRPRRANVGAGLERAVPSQGRAVLR